MPRDVFLSQVNRTVLKVTWTRPSSRVFVTHQRVYVESKGVQRAVDTGGSGRSLIVTDLQPESTYSVFVQTLSAQLPSTLSPPVTTFLGKLNGLFVRWDNVNRFSSNNMCVHVLQKTHYLFHHLPLHQLSRILHHLSLFPGTNQSSTLLTIINCSSPTPDLARTTSTNAWLKSMQTQESML